MFYQLKNWIISIVTVVIFMALIDLILPSNSLKKYAKLSTGLIVIIIILTPIFKIFYSGTSIENYVSSYITKYEKSESSDNFIKNDDFNNQTIRVFKENLKSSIEEVIHNDTHKQYRVSELQIVEDSNSLDFTSVKNIELEKVDNGNKVEAVAKIIIGNKHVEAADTWDNEVAKVLENKFNIKSSMIKFVK